MLNNKNWDLDEVGQTLNKAADLIEQYGHAKFTVQDAEGRMCIQGAVYMAINDNVDWNDTPLSTKSFEALSSHLGLKFTFQHEALVNVCKWNNYEAQSKNEVLNLLRTVASKRKVYQPA